MKHYAGAIADMGMSTDLREILSHHSRGARISMRRTTNGRGRVKVQFGPLHMRTKRYDLEDADYEELKELLRANPKPKS